jgi:hypothetical protein
VDRRWLIAAAPMFLRPRRCGWDSGHMGTLRMAVADSIGPWEVLAHLSGPCRRVLASYLGAIAAGAKAHLAIAANRFRQLRSTLRQP